MNREPRKRGLGGGANRPAGAPLGPTGPVALARRRGAKQDRRLGAAVLSLAGHLTILLALLAARTNLPKAIAAAPITVELFDERPPAAAPPPPAARPAPARLRPPRGIIKPTPAPADIDTPPIDEASAADSEAAPSDAELAGAASADSGPPGRACDMARWVQSALRKDPLVQAAVARARPLGGSAGAAIMVWNGDWVQRDGEDGKGLAAVREAIMWEVAFAPAACRAEPVRGLVLISPTAAPRSARLVVGSETWRWSDLLTPRAAVSDARSSGAR